MIFLSDIEAKFGRGPDKQPRKKKRLVNSQTVIGIGTGLGFARGGAAPVILDKWRYMSNRNSRNKTVKALKKANNPKDIAALRNRLKKIRIERGGLGYASKNFSGKNAILGATLGLASGMLTERLINKDYYKREKERNKLD